MLDYSIKLLNLFMFPFRDAFVDSELAYPVLIVVAFIPVVFLAKLLKEMTS